MNKKITLVDSYNLLQHSLDSLCKNFETEVVKGIFPYDFVKKSTLYNVTRYLLSTKKEGIVLSYNKDNIEDKVTVFVDSDKSGDSSRKSTSGVILMVNGNIIGWASRRQSAITKSASESELLALDYACEMIDKLMNLLKFVYGEDIKIDYMEDNSTVIKWASNPVSKGRNYHIDTRIKYIRNRLFLNQHFESIKKVPTEDNYSDILTKPVSGNTFNKLKNYLIK